jgi:hypothetical protein
MTVIVEPKIIYPNFFEYISEKLPENLFLYSFGSLYHRDDKGKDDEQVAFVDKNTVTILKDLYDIYNILLSLSEKYSGVTGTDIYIFLNSYKKIE